MKASALCLALLGVLSARAALAACEMPTLVRSIPDGATASEDDLLAVQAEIQAYVTAMDSYIACENEALEVDGDNATAEYLYLMTSRIEAARSEVDTVAREFNDQVDAFRAAREAGAPQQPPFVPPASAIPPR
jgi:hypothetical protein